MQLFIMQTAVNQPIDEFLLILIILSILRLCAFILHFHNLVLWQGLHLSAFALWKFQKLLSILTVINLLLISWKCKHLVCLSNLFFNSCVGSKKWLNWRREIELLSDLSYFSLTTFSGINLPNKCNLNFFYVSIFLVCFFAVICMSVLFSISNSGWRICPHYPGGPYETSHSLSS